MICWFKMNDWTSVLHSSLDDLVFLSKLSWAIWPFCVLLTYQYFSNTRGRCDTLVASPSLAPTQRESSPRDQPAIADWGIEDPRTSSEKNYSPIFPLQRRVFTWFHHHYRPENWRSKNNLWKKLFFNFPSSHQFTIITDRKIGDPRSCIKRKLIV